MASEFFAHDLMWWSHQLVHTGHDSVSAKSLERLDTERLRGEEVEGVSVLHRELHTTSTYFPLTTSISILTGIIVSIPQS